VSNAATDDIMGSVPAIVTNEEGLYEGDLVHYFQVFFREATNLRNPYHNFRHTCHVMWLCHKAARYYRDRLSPREIRSLLIAALFHDFDHTGKHGPDSINIELALQALDRHLLPEDRNQGIESLVSATEFPYTLGTDGLDLMARILRDADLGQAFSVAWIQQVIFGLSTEWGKDPLDLLRLQEPFHRNLRFQTEWGSLTFPPALVDAKVAEAQALLALLDDAGAPAALTTTAPSGSS